MHQPTLPPDDLPPERLTPVDALLRRQLENSIGKRFYEGCDGVTQGLLLSCEWYVTIDAKALTLVIACPDQSTNWRILNNMVAIASSLEPLSKQARIRVCPPVGSGDPFEIRVDEISIYQDSP
jgi:hypothetical protein